VTSGAETCAGPEGFVPGLLDAYTATRGFMGIPNVRRVERLARHTLLTKV